MENPKSLVARHQDCGNVELQNLRIMPVGVVYSAVGFGCHFLAGFAILLIVDVTH